MSINHDQAIFDAIVAAITSFGPGEFNVNVQKFIDTFNGHRDRKLCTSLTPEGQHMSNREIEKNEALARIHELEAVLKWIADIADKQFERGIEGARTLKRISDRARENL